MRDAQRRETAYFVCPFTKQNDSALPPTSTTESP